MSAILRTEYVAYCDECNDGSDVYDDEAGSEEWAANHDAEQHPDDARMDDDYERYKQAKDES